MYIKQLIAVMCGGALGSLLRFISVEKAHQLFGVRFPYGTVFVNVAGSLLIGFLAIFLVEKMGVSAIWRAAILIGFLGGFTTFSSFSLDTLGLLEQSSYLLALTNVLLSVLLCLSATFVGMHLARIMFE